jgi:hypothetical protein
MTALDCADPSIRVDRRNESLSPLQALALLNNGFMVSQAQHFSERLQREAPDLDGQVRRAHLLAFGHSAAPADQEKLVAFAKAHGLPNLCRVLLNLNEFVLSTDEHFAIPSLCGGQSAHPSRVSLAVRSGLGGIALASLLSGERALGDAGVLGGSLHHPAKAKQVVHFFMAGAASHLDLFDYKPELVKRERASRAISASRSRPSRTDWGRGSSRCGTSSRMGNAASF